MPTLNHMRRVVTCLLFTALITPALAHEMDGIDHVHLSNGMVQIVEPIPGGQPAVVVRPRQADTGVASPSTQPTGIAALLIQAGLILSALVLMVVALRAGTASHARRRKQTTDVPTHPSSPVPPA